MLSYGFIAATKSIGKSLLSFGLNIYLLTWFLSYFNLYLLQTILSDWYIWMCHLGVELNWREKKKKSTKKLA